MCEKCGNVSRGIATSMYLMAWGWVFFFFNDVSHCCFFVCLLACLLIQCNGCRSCCQGKDVPEWGVAVAPVLFFSFFLSFITPRSFFYDFLMSSLSFFFFWRRREKQMEHATPSFFFSCNRESSWFNVTSKSDTALLLYSPFFFFDECWTPQQGKINRSCIPFY